LRKGDLRAAYRRVRDSIPREEKESLDRAVQDHLLNWRMYRDARCIFCFVSFRSEIDTRGIVKAALEAGKTVTAPRVDQRAREMKAYVIRDPLRDLTPGFYGIFEPVECCEEALYDDIDLLIAPGLAFTARGDRLGYGGGFYDSFMKMHYNLINCALTYDRFIADSLPVKEHDRAVDYLITESGVKKTARGDHGRFQRHLLGRQG
jgi:5-formyltetrahydrofolate cyclo-ligase